MMIQFIDPGVRFCGFAEFYPNGTLACALYEKTDRLLSSQDIDVFAMRVIEKPRIYNSSSQKGDQNDLIDLAVVVGQLAHGNYKLIYPQEWKGTVNADVMTARINDAVRRRGEGRCVHLPSAKSKHHNVYDAIGMGYHHFGHLNKRTIRRGGKHG